MDALVGDSKMEFDVVLTEWRNYSKSLEGLREGQGHGDKCVDTQEKKYTPPDLFLKLRTRHRTLN
jgi:hypothetical protein